MGGKGGVATCDYPDCYVKVGCLNENPFVKYCTPFSYLGKHNYLLLNGHFTNRFWKKTFESENLKSKTKIKCEWRLNSTLSFSLNSDMILLLHSIWIIWSKH